MRGVLNDALLRCCGRSLNPEGLWSPGGGVGARVGERPEVFFRVREDEPVDARDDDAPDATLKSNFSDIRPGV
jgi:hypothetical protein